jgi:hypothetical protein
MPAPVIISMFYFLAINYAIWSIEVAYVENPFGYSLKSVWFAIEFIASENAF